MKILLVNSHKFGGVEYYRALKPNSVLNSIYPEFEFHSINVLHPTEDIEATINGEQIVINDEWLKQFDLIHFLRQIGFEGWTQGIADRLNKLGIPFGLDLDDYWHLPENHLIYEEYKRFNTTETIIESIKVAKFVTCTTEYLKKEIEQLNPNVHILENGIDETDPTWQPEYLESELTRFGLMLGSTHYHDLKKAAPSINNLFRSTNKGYQICLAGFNAKMGEPSIYVGMEKMITDNHNLLNPRYSFYLKSCTKEKNELWADQKYFRLWGVDVTEWGYQYRNIDISLVPLVDNKFNSCKSELKVIEAGFKGKGLIVSNVKPYDLICNDKNSYLVNTSSEWYDKIKRALNNPNEVYDKTSQLHEDVKKKYSLQLLTDKRKELYENWSTMCK